MTVIDACYPSKFDRNLVYELKKGGVTAVTVSLDMWAQARETMGNIAQWYKFINENSDILYLVQTGADITTAEAEGKVGIILGIQNTSPLEDDLSLVEAFNRLGLKVMLLTYNNQNLVGSGCYEATDNGLSRFGRNVVKEMNRVGMVIDLAHCGKRTTIDAIHTSDRPVAITHANPDWIYPTKRSKSKEELGALRDNQGMLGLTLFPTMIGGADTTMEEFAELVAKTADFMGVDNIGLGSDLVTNRDDAFMHWVRMGRWTHEIDYGTGTKDTPTRAPWPKWFQGAADFPNISEALTNKGFSETEVQGIMGENWKRFFESGFSPKDASASA